MLNTNNSSQAFISDRGLDDSEASVNQVEFKTENSREPKNNLLNLTANSNVAIPALKQSEHQKMSEDYDGTSNAIKQSRPVKDEGMARETRGREKPQGQVKSGVEDENKRNGSVENSSKNDTDFVLNFQTTPTPSSQLLQTYPGAISYNVKLTNEESPPGKEAKLKPANPTPVKR
jgi:hypothetical protein